jgi:hypothetical protein
LSSFGTQIINGIERYSTADSRQQHSIQPLSRYGFPIKTTKGHGTPISDFIIDHFDLMAVSYVYKLSF